MLFRTYWSDGNANSYSLLLRNQSSANYSRGSSTWRNELEWIYGMQQQGADPLFKTHDRLAIESQYGFKASSVWNYSALFQFNTLLSKSYNRGSPKTDSTDPFISRFFSPARFTFALGMEYQNTTDNTAPNQRNPNLIRALFSPIGFRATYVMDTTLSLRFNVPRNKHWSATVGPTVLLNNRHRLNQDITLGSRLELSADLLEMKDPFVRVDWRLNLDIRLSRYFTLGFESWVLYDPNEFFTIDRKGNSIPNVTINSKGEEIPGRRRVQYQQSWRLRFVYRITG